MFILRECQKESISHESTCWRYDCKLFEDRSKLCMNSLSKVCYDWSRELVHLSEIPSNWDKCGTCRNSFKLGQMRHMQRFLQIGTNAANVVRAKSRTCLFWEKPDSICPGQILHLPFLTKTRFYLSGQRHRNIVAICRAHQSSLYQMFWGMLCVHFGTPLKLRWWPSRILENTTCMSCWRFLCCHPPSR